jgi:ABC-type multidrug transport system ATPase subunit
VACYVEETDNNEPLLTVRETLEFAGTCILPVPTKRLRHTQWFQLLVEKLELDEVTKRDLLAGKNVGSLKVKGGEGGRGGGIILAIDIGGRET